MTLGLLLNRSHHCEMLSASRKLEFDDCGKFDSTRTLAFMHVPKTSGLALTAGLAAAIGVPDYVSGLDLSLFGGFQAFDTFEPSSREHIYESSARLPSGAAFIAGHFALSTLRRAYPRAQVISILREPTSRLLSHWLYWRQHTDTALTCLGLWADVVRTARQPLSTFLSEPNVACQTDNLALRMLLWPHPAVLSDQFIDPADDDMLVKEATLRLAGFDFVDLLENSSFPRNLERWLGRSLKYDRVNETGEIPMPFRSPLCAEFTTAAYELLRARSRLDLRLWDGVTARRMRGQDSSALREQALLANVARYGVLMA